MKPQDLVDKEILTAFNGNLPTVNVDATNLQATRDFFFKMKASFPDQTSDQVSVREQIFPSELNPGGVKVFIYRKKDSTQLKPAILHLHAGGFVLGEAGMDTNYCKKMALDLDAVVISVDYRLAPEAVFPGALEDSYAALKWAWNKSADLGLDQNKFAIAGESAGAGLAAQLAFLIRDRALVKIKLQFLAYPMLDDRTGSVLDPGKYFGESGWSRSSNIFAWSALLNQQAGSPQVPYPSVPARMEDLSGLAPAYLAVGTVDLFAKEVAAYSVRLMEQGVPVEFHLYKGATHGFDGLVGSQLSKRFFEERKRAFEAAFRE